MQLEILLFLSISLINEFIPADCLSRGELTLGERVVAQRVLPEAPNAGQPYTADIHWQYDRFTTGASYHHAVSETQVNVYVAGPVETDTPDVVQAFEPLWVRASFRRDNGDFFRGNELTGHAAGNRRPAYRRHVHRQRHRNHFR